MAEAEYIEREALIEEAKHNKAVCQAIADIVDVKDIINNTPAADVVEVVRCKDCEYASYWYGNDNLKNTTYLCFLAEDEGVKTFADDFCSRGKRRE